VGVDGRTSTAPGTVFIVGAGPGPGDLITVRGLRVLQRADVVIADELLPRSFFEDLDLTLPADRVIWREDGERSLSQAEVNELLVGHALEGRTVVRLKGGDPGVFGRGWEEAALLSSHRIPWQIIPGLTAGTALPALAGLSLTHRGEGRSVALATGRLRRGALNHDLPRADSLVLYMSVSGLPELTERLLATGWAPGTPAAIIERGGLPWERRFARSLAEIARIASDADLRSPSLIIVGEAARRRVDQPLVLFTGLDPSNFRTLGDLTHWPALQIVEAPDAEARVEQAIESLQAGPQSTVVFTSKVGVRAFFRAAGAGWDDLGLPSETRVIAAGPATGEVLRRHGVTRVLSPGTLGATGVLDLLSGRHTGNCILVQGAQADGDLARRLDGRFDSVTRLSLHRAVTHPELGAVPLPDHDAIFFTSPSGVRAYHHEFGAAAFRRDVLCIGEPTRAALRALGVDGKVVYPDAS
jgi:uroporphyrin-III C-methyltransferase